MMVFGHPGEFLRGKPESLEWMAKKKKKILNRARRLSRAEEKIL